MEKRYFIIDGNYFAHRALHGIRTNQTDFNLSTIQQMNNFESLLNNSFITLVKSFNNTFHDLFENFIFVFDHKSWRKSIEPYKPYYINDETLIGYKENRVEKKEVSDIDYNNLHICIDNFRNKIKSIIPIIHFDGGEGDDGLLLLTNKFNKQNIESIIFATDGDLKYLVNKNTIFFSNTKSKDLPDGQFIISNYLSSKLFSEKSLIEKFTQLNIENNFYDLLFAIDITTSGTVKSNKFRKLNSGISITNKWQNLIVKIISGDAKDNIFPIFRWRNTKNTMNMKVTEAMIKKAFEQSLMDFNEKNIYECFNDGKLMGQILVNLKSITKQTEVPLNKIVEHYQHNLRLEQLDIKSLPTEIIQNFEECYSKNIDLIYKKIDIIELEKINLQVNQIDNAKELIIDSIDKNFNNKFENIQNQSLIDDILGL